MPEPIISKKCCDCKAIKPFPDFNKNRTAKDGHQDFCRICQSIRAKEYSQTKKGKQSHLLRNKKYYQSNKGKNTAKLYRKLHKQINIIKNKARSKIGHAIENGKMVCPDRFQCACGEQAKEYHHPNYEHWFNVIAICISCHRKLHHP